MFAHTYSGVAQTLVSMAPNPAIFMLPMSKNSRELTQRLFEAVGTLIRPGITQVSIIQGISNRWDPTIFENAVSKYRNLTNKTHNIKFPKKVTLDQIVNTFNLEGVDDEWATNNGLDVNGKCVGFLTTPKVINTYTWLTKSFLLADFNESDLNKIVAMGQYDLSQIVSICSTIHDQNKRTVSYLYAAVMDTQQRNDAIKYRQSTNDKDNSQKLVKLISDLSDTTGPYNSDVDNRRSQWDFDRAFIDQTE